MIVYANFGYAGTRGSAGVFSLAFPQSGADAPPSGPTDTVVFRSVRDLTPLVIVRDMS